MNLPFSLEEIAKLPLSEQRAILQQLDEYLGKKHLADAASSYSAFRKAIYPDYIDGRHLREMAKIFDAIVRGELRRVSINVPPRHSKSTNTSWLFPSYYFGRFPKSKVMQIMNTANLSAKFGRSVRDTIESSEYQEIFPNTKINPGNRSAAEWSTLAGGEYYATGTGGAIAGRGANILVIDDPHTDEQGKAAMYNPKIFDETYDWYQTGPRQRLQPGGSILITVTRWGKRDLPGRVLQEAIENGSIGEWKVFEFPATLDNDTSPLWEEFYPLEELLQIKRDIPAFRWLAQYQQTPTAESGAIIKRSWWRQWERSRLPEFSYVLQSWDTAHTSKTTGDYSACTTWGVFYHPNADGRSVANLMLIDSYRDRLEFSDLKLRVKELMRDHSPDTVLIENRGSGTSLLSELHNMGIPAEEYTPARGAAGAPNDKVARANSVADVFSSGMVWFNDSCKLNETTIEECSDLPRGDHDDLADTVTQAVKRLRDGYFIGTINDDYQLYDEDDEPAPFPRGRIY